MMSRFELLSLVGIGATFVVSIAALVISMLTRTDSRRDRRRREEDDGRYEEVVARLVADLAQGGGAIDVLAEEYRFAARAVTEKRLMWSGYGTTIMLPSPPYST